MAFPGHIPNSGLSLDRIPLPDADWTAIHTLAYTFDAYDHFQSNGRVAWIANNHCTSTLSEARACLFYEHRRRVHAPEAFDSPTLQAWVRELIARIRAFVERGFLDDDRKHNRDFTRYVRWHARYRDDLWDHDTTYEIAVLDTATTEQVAYLSGHTAAARPARAVSCYPTCAGAKTERLC